MKWSGDTIMHSAFVSVCRLCMAEGTECMRPIFSEIEHDGEKFMLSARINAVTSLKVRQGDHLPEQACQDCIAQLNRWYEFKTLCDGADKELRQRLKQLEGDPDPVLFQLKEELPEAAANAVRPPPHPAHNSPIFPANGESVSYSLVQDSNGIGRISGAFSLPQGTNTVSHGFLFNGDTSIQQQSQPIPSSTNSTLAFLCTLCDVRFARKMQLKRHIAAHCGEPPHPCSRCDAGFTQRAALEKHKLTHLPLPAFRSAIRPPVRIYNCPQCHWSFRHPRALLHHQATHTGPSRQQCVFCRRICTSAMQLQFHLQLAHRRGQRHRQCLRCQKSFMSFAAFLQHICTRKSTSKTIITSFGRSAVRTTARTMVSSNTTSTPVRAMATSGATRTVPANPSNLLNRSSTVGRTVTQRSATHDMPSLSVLTYQSEYDSARNLENTPKTYTKTFADNLDCASNHSSGHSSDTSRPSNLHFSSDTSDQSLDHGADNSNDQFADSSFNSGAGHSDDFSSDQSNNHSSDHTDDMSEDLSKHGTEESPEPLPMDTNEGLPLLTEES